MNGKEGGREGRREGEGEERGKARSHRCGLRRFACVIPWEPVFFFPQVRVLMPFPPPSPVSFPLPCRFRSRFSTLLIDKKAIEVSLLEEALSPQHILAQIIKPESRHLFYDGLVEASFSAASPFSIKTTSRVLKVASLPWPDLLHSSLFSP
jgi:hypothetical protein